MTDTFEGLSRPLSLATKTLFPSAPADLPPVLWKALGKDTEVARAHFKEIEALPCAAEQKDRIVSAYPVAVENGRAASLLETLAVVRHQPEAGALFERYARASKGLDGKTARADLTLALTEATRRGASPVATYDEVVAVRNFDPYLKGDGYAPARLDAVAAFVLDAPTPAERASMLEALGASATKFGLDKALEFVRPLASLKATGVEREAVLALHCDLVKRCSSRELPHVLASCAAVDVPGQATSLVTDFRALQAASKRIDLAVADLTLASRASNGCPRAEAVAMLARIRERDPALAEGYGQFDDPTAALDYALHGTHDTAALRLSSLLTLQVGGRNASEALAIEQRIAAASCGAAERGALRVLVGKCMEKYRAKSDPFLADILANIDGPDAPARFALAQSLLDVTKSVARASTDLKTCLDVSAARGVPLDECVGHLKTLLERDPAVKEGYINGAASAADALDEIAGGATPDHRAATRGDLLALHIGGRNADQAVALLRAARITGAGPDDTADMLKRLVGHLEKFSARYDAAFIAALGEAGASGRPAVAFAAFDQVLAAVKNPAAALGDLQTARAMASERAVDFERAIETVLALRQADPVGNDYYGAWVPLREALETLLPTGTSADQARLGASRLASLQVHGRDTQKALAHERALRALPCSEGEREAARAILLPLLHKYSASRDALLLDVLAQSARSGAPLVTLQAFGRLLEVSGGRLEVAGADLGLAVEIASKGHALGEAADLLVALRTDDPARKDGYASFQDARAALAWSFDASSPSERTARARLLQAHQRAACELDAAVGVEQRILALHARPADHGAVREAWFTVLASYGGRRRESVELIKVFDAVDGQPDAAARVKVFGALVAAAGSPAQALRDLDLVVGVATAKGLPLDEVAGLASDIRRADSSARYGQAADLGDAVALVADGADATARAARAASLRQLLEAAGKAPVAVHGLQTILASPLAEGGLEDATRKMASIARLEGAEAEVDAVYAHLQSKASTEHFSWLKRVLHLARPYERVVWEVMAMSRSASTVLGVLDGLERAALPGESPRAGLKRFKKMLKYDPDYGYHQLSVERAQQAFSASLQGLPWSQEGPQARWKRFSEMAKELPGVASLAAVWSAASSADSEAEYEARRVAFSRLSEACGAASRQAVAAYTALTEGLGPSDAIAAILPDMLTLLGGQRPEIAAETWRIARGSRGLSAPEMAAQNEILAHARSSEDLRALWEGLRTTVGGETFLQRADALKQALGGGLPPREAAKQLAAMTTDLGADLQTCLSAYASLVTVLRARTRTPMPEAADLLSHARHLREEGSRDGAGIEPTPLVDMLMGLTQSLLMGSDTERAKSQLRVVEEQRRKAPMTEGKGGRIDVADGEINVGGIRIPRRA